MLSPNVLKDLLSGDLTDTEKVMICLAVEPVTPRAVKEVVELAFGAGWRGVKKKNVSQILSRAKGLVIRSNGGWELTSSGTTAVASLAGPAMRSPIPKNAFSLRSHLSRITNPDTRAFVEESISCYEGRLYRAAVVLSWMGAVSVLHDYVFTNKLAEFNMEAKRRDPNWKPAKSRDDLGLMKEDTFLDVLQAISIIGKNVKQELKKALTLRNGCGHPNSMKIAEFKVGAHIEDLTLNVFSTFS